MSSPEKRVRLERLRLRARITAGIGAAVAVAGHIAGSRGLFAAGAAFALLQGVLAVMIRPARG
jgi:hypothetical protein